MSNQPNVHQSIVRRLNSLESQNKILRLFLVAVTVIVVGCSQAGIITDKNSVNAVSEQGVLELKQLIFRDNNSNVRIKIDSTDDSNIKQSFFDKQGVERAQISIDEMGNARYRLFDTAGTKRVTLYALSDTDEELPNEAGVIISRFDRQDNSTENSSVLGVNISTSPDGTVQEQIFDDSGFVREAAIIESDGVSNHIMYDSSGDAREFFGTYNNGLATHQISDTFGTVREFFGTSSKGLASHILNDATGMARYEINTFNNDSRVANQVLYDPNGTVRQANFTSSSQSGEIHQDSNEVPKTSTIISEDNSLAHYVEKNASQRAIGILDGILRAKDAVDLFRGSGQ